MVVSAIDLFLGNTCRSRIKLTSYIKLQLSIFREKFNFFLKKTVLVRKGYVQLHINVPNTHDIFGRTSKY